ncbi:MAG: hypothetical protein IJ560_01830 [Alphaproteobacteria bacterium]|nr:hypothetical protein [Alphaproteobacteria bacterium]
MHGAIWAAINIIAANQNMSNSGLARFCGLDATTFNKSKRYSKYGQPRWLSMETLNKVLNATGTSFTEFARIVDNQLRKDGERN